MQIKHFIILILLISTYSKLFSQCAVVSGANSIVGSTTCTGCTATAADGDNIGSGDTKCVSSNLGTFTSNYTITYGILRICSGGTLTINTLKFTPTTTARVIVESGGTLTIVNAQGTSSGDFAYSNKNSIENYGTLNFTNAINIGSGTGTKNYIYTGSTGTTNFNGAVTIDNTNGLINDGTVNITGTLTLNSGTAPLICLDKSIMTVGNLTNYGSNYIGWGGLSGGADSAVINFSGTQNYVWNPLTDNSRVHLCRTAGSNDLCASGCANQYGSATYRSHTCSTPLPVLYGFLKATKNNQGAEIRWQTTQEFQNDHFEILRSLDGFSWEVIAEVKGQGTKLSSTSYMYQDNEVSNLKTFYYKIKQVDLDGKYEYSSMLMVHNQDIESSFNTFPNPIKEKDNLFIKFSDDEIGDATIIIYDISGKAIKTINIDNLIPNEIYIVESNTLQLTKGTYFLKIKTPQNIHRQELLVY